METGQAAPGLLCGFRWLFLFSPLPVGGSKAVGVCRARQVRLYTAKYELVATHERAQKAGERHTHLDHLPQEKLPGLLLDRDSCLSEARKLVLQLSRLCRPFWMTRWWNACQLPVGWCACASALAMSAWKLPAAGHWPSAIPVTRRSSASWSRAWSKNSKPSR